MKNCLGVVLLFVLITYNSFGQLNVTDSIVHQSHQRKYIVHIPTTYSSETATPLVLMLHGGGGTMTSAMGFTGLNQVSNANNFLAVYPQGYGVIPSGGYSWADGRGTSADNAGIDDIGFINKLLDTLSVDYNVDVNKIYLCGFSNGGFMTQRIACELNSRFAAMASLASIMDTTLIENCNPERAIPMLFMQGTDDPLVPYNGGTMVGSGLVTPIVGIDTLINFWKTNNNCATIGIPINLPDIDATDESTVTVYNYSDCSCNSDVKFYKINGGGHTWPGIEIPSYEVIAGQTNEDIQANTELWNFFNSHILCNLPLNLNEETTQQNLKIYPNPSNNQLTLNISKNKNVEISIINELGQIVLKKQNTNQIDVSDLQVGVYKILINLEGIRYIQKFIKH